MSYRYADIPTNMTVHPASGDLIRLVDNNAITSQIENLVRTDFYEIPWSPTQGAGVPQTLFDNYSNDFEYNLTTRIKENITKYVSRAKLLNVVVNYDGNNGYTVTIIYQPINSLEKITTSLTLTRTR